MYAFQSPDSVHIEIRAIAINCYTFRITCIWTDKRMDLHAYLPPTMLTFAQINCISRPPVSAVERSRRQYATTSSDQWKISQTSPYSLSTLRSYYQHESTSLNAISLLPKMADDDMTRQARTWQAGDDLTWQKLAFRRTSSDHAMAYLHCVATIIELHSTDRGAVRTLLLASWNNI